MGDYSWVLWVIIPFLFFSMAGRHSAWGCSGRSRRSRSRKSEEISRLKQELEASQAQIDALKARLEAVETIVTDEEAELRREFYKLQNS
ncbi:MAG: hypothetical protein AAGL90_06745 [Pseudomonadota bacterium]